MIARRVRVTGRVQGVFFRHWTCQQARELGVKGWVRNVDDGSVEASLQGDEGAVADLIARLHHGPPGAQVSDVEIENAEPENLGEFGVRH